MQEARDNASSGLSLPVQEFRRGIRENVDRNGGDPAFFSAKTATNFALSNGKKCSILTLLLRRGVSTAASFPNQLFYSLLGGKTMALVEVTKNGHVGIVTMNRPEALNALSKAVFADLSKALDVVEQDDDVYVVIITGQGRSFIAGADIGEMATMNVEEGLAFSELGNSLLMRVDMFPKPTIAAVNGFALGGGCEMALACDIRVASEKAKFGQPEVGLGIIPGFGGTQRMARIIGTGPAMELIYTAETINAQRALELGMVNHVYAPEELMDKAQELANKICANAQVAIRTSKMAIRRGIDCDISTAVTYEALAFATCFGTEDQKDAMKAFVEKRKLDGFKNR